MRDALQLLFALVCGEVIKDKDGAFPTREKLLETKDLPPVPHARLGQDLQFRDGIERHAFRVQPLDFARMRLTVSPSSTSEG